jgi:phage FluMu gp28-like protein
MGIQLGERMMQRWGEHRIDKVVFTQNTKADLATGLKAKVEKEELAIPSDSDIVSDWRGIEQTVSKSGVILYTAEKTSGGHCDRFWAAALGVYAAGATPSREIVMAFA